MADKVFMLSYYKVLSIPPIEYVFSREWQTTADKLATGLGFLIRTS